jgi:hypothetical protein
MSPQHHELANWIPYKLSGTFCNWLFLGNKKFTEPFFNDTISACKKLNENRSPYQVISDLEIMIEWSEKIDALNPSALIFHVSRCGSTLLTQLLCLDEANIALSEVPFLDELLRLRYTDSISTKIKNGYLSAAIKYYGRKRIDNEKFFFIKTDSWHLHFYTQLRNLFPEVPFILLFRNPFEVILSQQKQRGRHSVPGLIEPAVFGFSGKLITEINLDVYMTNVLEGYFKKMIEIVKADNKVLLFNYNEGMHNILKKVGRYFRLRFTNEKEKLLQERIRFHAKHPQQIFKEDHKAADTPDYLIPALELYQELEDIRSTVS